MTRSGPGGDEEDRVSVSSLPARCGTQAFDVAACVAATAEVVEVVRTTLNSLEPDLDVMRALNVVAQRFPEDARTHFDGRAAAVQLGGVLDGEVRKVKGRGTTYGAFVARVDGVLQVIDGHAAAVARNLHAIDQNCAVDRNRYGECARADNGVMALRRAYASITALLDDGPGERSPTGKAVAAFRSAVNLIGQYQRRLGNDGDESSVVMIEVSPNLPGGRRVVVQVPFVSRTGESRVRITRNLLLVSEHDYPAVFATVGVTRVVSEFDFKVPILAEELNDGGDGVVRRFDVAGAGRFRPVNAMFLTHITLGRPKWLYASVGTTADRNIFRNVMLGVSGYIPKWWSAVSVGVIAARGSGEDATREAFGALTNPITGLALGSPSGVRGTEGWHYRGFLGVSFNPFAR